MMKNLFFLISTCLISFQNLQAQCDFDFTYINTGTNMTVFFTPSASQSIYSELGDGIVGAFFKDENSSYRCGVSEAFTAAPIQLAVMADDSTTPEKEGFAAGDEIFWFYKTTDGSYHTLNLDPSENFAINGINYITSATTQPRDCGDVCPPLDLDFVNTGSNMTLFVTPAAVNDLLPLGDGVIAVYFEKDGELTCAGSEEFTGSQVQISAMADDATTTEKDGFSDGDSVLWKFQDTNGNQYEISPGPYEAFSLNGISYVTSLSFAPISCAVDVEGCTNDDYIEYNPQATMDDNSCNTLAVGGCTNASYLEYDATVNVDDGSCLNLIVSGCINSNYLEYNAEANVDDNSCSILVVSGCNDVNAENFSSDANSNDGSCEYDIIPEDCKISFETSNTGSNHTLMIPGSATSQLNVGDLVGVFFVSENGSAVCAGSSEWTGENMQIVAYGDDTTTPQVDGLSPGNPFLFLVQSGDDLLSVTAEFRAANEDMFAVNGLSFITSFDFTYACTEEKLGCTDDLACNYDGAANTNDISCTYPENYYSCSGSCLNDVDGDLVCDELEVEGCTNASASNYDESATDDNGSCISWKDAYENCLTSGGDDGVTQSDVDAVQALLDVANADLAIALANQGADDGVTQSDVDAVQALLDVANNQIDVLNAQIDNAPGDGGGGSCEPIVVDLLEGWNIIGYTLPYEQDVTATMASVLSDLQIVKNNDAKVYWPEYGFNGIGNYIPGQGYQIRMSSSVLDYTFPDVRGQRVELSPRVPAWVHDLPVLNHPNDTRTLVKVVNMLGQEVDPSSQFKGEVLLYLYSDGTTEKLLVK
jgi:hypothetical protein